MPRRWPLKGTLRTVDRPTRPAAPSRAASLTSHWVPARHANGSCRCALLDLSHLNDRQRSVVGLVLRQQLDHHVVQRKMNSLGLIDAPAFRDALGGVTSHTGCAVCGAMKARLDISARARRRNMFVQSKQQAVV